MRLLLILLMASAVLLFAFLVRDRVYGRRKELFGVAPGVMDQLASTQAPSMEPIEEFFGMAPGVMTQLASTHVPTEEDEYWALKGYTQQVNHDLKDMTGQGLYA